MDKLRNYLELQLTVKEYINIKDLLKDIEDGDFNAST